MLMDVTILEIYFIWQIDKLFVVFFQEFEYSCMPFSLKKNIVGMVETYWNAIEDTN